MWFLLIVLPACLRLSEAAFLQECEGYIINLIRNPNQECSEYIYCNGDNSYYCNGECDETVSCYEDESSTATPTTATPTHPPTTLATLSTTLQPSPTTTATTIMTTPSSGRAETPTTETVLQSSTSPTPQTSTPSTTAGTMVSPHVRCRQSERNEVYPYPANETYYYQCISKFLLLQQCPQNFYFNESQGKCIVRSSYR